MSAFNAATPTQEGHTVPAVARVYRAPDFSGSQRLRVSRYPVAFTGSGAEYFSIWIRDTLLTLVTLGLYYPWARAHRLRYLCEHTWLDDQPLRFTGRPERMLRGHALIMALLGIALTSHRSWPAATLVSALALLLMWPALMQTAIRFKLAHTVWNHRSLTFSGTIPGAYAAAWSPIAVVLGAALIGTIVAIGTRPSDHQLAGIISATPTLLAVMLMIPYAWWRWKTYLHDQFKVGEISTQCRVTWQEAFALFLKTLGVLVLGMIGASASFMAIVTLTMLSQPTGNVTPLATVLRDMSPLLLLFVGIGSVAPIAYFVSRSQNLVWTNTGNEWLRFKSLLEFGPLFWLTLKNLTLLLCTLGLYWPFAYIDWLRLRYQALSLHTRIPLEEWHSKQSAISP
ncbi:MAG TPA: DUF898 family protein [Aquabacterium sp.]|nr:DUF898 family protein [Aquabacterium sp.]